MNFAHGDAIAFSVFALRWLSIDAVAVVFAGKKPWYLLVPFVLAIGAAVSVLCEVLVFRRFRRANPATMMIASFALGFVIRYFLLMLFSSRPKSISPLPEMSQPVLIPGARIPLLQVVTILETMVILFSLTAFLKRTRYELEMRAVTENFTMARMLGVWANRVILAAFARSGALAAAIGRILAAQTGSVDIQMVGAVMLMAFIGMVIGGLGSLPGAVLAGFLLGAASVVMQVVLPVEARPFRDAFVYGAVILVLIWRPLGLLTAHGTKENDHAKKECLAGRFFRHRSGATGPGG